MSKDMGCYQGIYRGRMTGEIHHRMGLPYEKAIEYLYMSARNDSDPDLSIVRSNEKGGIEVFDLVGFERITEAQEVEVVE